MEFIRPTIWKRSTMFQITVNQRKLQTVTSRYVMDVWCVIENHTWSEQSKKTRKPQTYKVYCLELSFLKSDELVLLNFRNKSFPVVISEVHPSIKAQSTVILTVWCQPFIKVNTWWERHKFSDFWYFSDKTFNILFL